MSPAVAASLKSRIQDVPDFPKKGIVFKDITPLLGDPKAFAAMTDAIAERYTGKGVTHVAGIESRGFLLASAAAYKLGAGLVPIRKKGKLPRKTLTESYALEYGTDSIEMHADAVDARSRVVLVDDVIATGGTARAALELLTKTGAKVLGASFLIELDFLKGREKLAGWDLHSLLHY
ncbi:MAG TPA: adenine phosphoribosyltransferase [Elusimicrobiota bacterium]|jgi:adenine phosphoribosyltransferase|nr:adenine phosphoribosyltransferase [Elusimicrobiota bacterium]